MAATERFDRADEADEEDGAAGVGEVERDREVEVVDREPDEGADLLRCERRGLQAGHLRRDEAGGEHTVRPSMNADGSGPGVQPEDEFHGVDLRHLGQRHGGAHRRMSGEWEFARRRED